MSVHFFYPIGMQQQKQNADQDQDGLVDKARSKKHIDEDKDGVVDNAYQATLDNSQILIESYRVFVKNGSLTNKEINILEKIGTILEGTDIKINRQTGDAIIIQPNRNNITLTFLSKGMSEAESLRR